MWEYGFLVRRMIANMTFPTTQKSGVLSMGTRVKIVRLGGYCKAEVVDGPYTGGGFIMQLWDADNYWKED